MRSLHVIYKKLVVCMDNHWSLPEEKVSNPLVSKSSLQEESHQWTVMVSFKLHNLIIALVSAVKVFFKAIILSAWIYYEIYLYQLQ